MIVIMISKFIHYDPVQRCVRGHMLQKMGSRLLKITNFLKTHSDGIMKSCVRNCEYLIAYKLRRGQQAVCLYTKLWGEARFKEILMQLQRKLVRQLTQRNRALMFTGGLVMFDWNKNRIKESYMKQHYLDIDYINYLTLVTMTCSVCHKRLVVDIPCSNIVYCQCANSKSVYNKKFESVPWMPFLERQDLLVWRKEKDRNPGLYEYKLYGVYEEVRADMFLQVQIDTEYRKKWDATAVEIKVVDADPYSNSHVLYWEMQWPKFFANRDYVFNRRYIIDSDENVIVVTNQIAEHPGAPEDPNKHRVKEYYCTMVIKPFTTFDEPGVKFCMTYFDNPGLTIPGPVQTWVATSAMPDFLSRLRNASVKYEKSLTEVKSLQACSNRFFKDFSNAFYKKNFIEVPTIVSIFKDHFIPS